MSAAQYEDVLDDLGAAIRSQLHRPVIVAGDFNAKSVLWGSRRTDTKGSTLEMWAAALGLCLLNTGNKSTLVRPQGESIVDLTWANPPAAGRTENWRVTEDETLSDHLYVMMRDNVARQRVPCRAHRGEDSPRWALKKLDVDGLVTMVASATWPGAKMPESIEGRVEWLRGIMKDACDACMPRAKETSCRATYWWSGEIAEQRQQTVRARRRFTRLRRRDDDEATAEAYDVWRQERSALSIAIKKAKAKAWEEHLHTLNSDPWGRPYKNVMNKLRKGAPSATETLESQELIALIDRLFPTIEGVQLPQGPPEEWDESLEVSGTEITGIAGRLRARGNKAPGPDGIPGRVWVLALAQPSMSTFIRQLFTDCLREGYFPPVWEEANLVLIPKGGGAPGAPPAYRPICLLDEAGKMLERVIVDRLVRHLSQDGPDLHGDQYGFRKERSTIDAIKRVRSLAESIMDEGGVAMAISLDIVNAFNTLPWDRVGSAMEFHRVPQYLVKIVGSYFRTRKLAYRDRDGVRCGRDVSCGVPQGLVLGPLLWDLAFDHVLRTALPPSCNVVCYADDTLVMAGGNNWGEVKTRTELAVACVVRNIRDMGLKVAPHKTEALYFHDGQHGRPPRTHVLVDDTPVQVEPRIKYLGLILDGNWTFVDHFDRLAPKVVGVANALSRLLPNLGGPDGRVRRMYAGVVNSVALYGAPVWAEAANRKPKKIRDALRRIQRRVAIRVIRGYRTVSHAAASTLAGLPPMEHVARMYQSTYEQTRELRRRNIIVTAGVRNGIKVQARRRLIEGWKEYLDGIPETRSGKRVVGAVRPVLDEWMDRTHGEVSYHLAQVLTGHGCFAEFLCKIGKERTTQCWHCEDEEDTAQHTLAHCDAWARERGVLKETVGDDLSLSAIIPKMAESEEAWKAMSSFCSSVMRQKEDAERERERAPLSGEESENDGGDGGAQPPRNPRNRRRRARRRDQQHPPQPGGRRGGRRTRGKD